MAYKLDRRRKNNLGLILTGISLIFTSVIIIIAHGIPFRVMPRHRDAVLQAAPMPQGDVDVNHGDIEQLTELDGVGESIAAEIIAERERDGAFFLPEDLRDARGIGEKKLRKFWHQLDWRRD